VAATAGAADFESAPLRRPAIAVAALSLLLRCGPVLAKTGGAAAMARKAAAKRWRPFRIQRFRPSDPDVI
jgi:hypothetical protein